MSECPVMGAYNEKGQAVLLKPQRETMNGSKVG